MTARTSPARGWLIAATTVTAAAICLLPAAGAFAAETAAKAPAVSAQAAQASTPAEMLAATPWETTSAVDQDGNAVALDDPRAVNFVGNAYFKADGTYTMFNLDDSPKLTGDWEMRVVDGQLVRWINAKNDAGDVLWERVVLIVKLDGSEFTYRVVDANDSSKWVDIVHTPTTHIEPGTESAAIAAATAALSKTPWETTSSVDQDGNAVALDDPRAVNFVGNAYFKADGTYTMFNLDDSPKLTGDWEMRVVDGQLVRWINAKNDAGDVLWERVVLIVKLDGSEFTYRVVDANDSSKWVDIVHTPTTHAEPGTGTGGASGGSNGGSNGGTNGGSNDGSNGGANGGSNGGSDGGANSGSTGGNVDANGNGQGSGAKGSLAVTGGQSAVAGIVAAAIAALGGGGLIGFRALRRFRA